MSLLVLTGLNEWTFFLRENVKLSCAALQPTNLVTMASKEIKF